MIEQIRLNVAPTRDTVVKHCYTEEQRESLPDTARRCRRCAYPTETTEHVFLECPTHRLSRNLLRLAVKALILRAGINSVPTIPQLIYSLALEQSPKAIQQSLENIIVTYVSSIWQNHPLPLIRKGFKSVLLWEPP